MAESEPSTEALVDGLMAPVDAVESFDVDDLNPCGDVTFLPGLEDLNNAVCGIAPLVAGAR